MPLVRQRRWLCHLAAQAFIAPFVKHGSDQPDPWQVAVRLGAAVSKAGWSAPPCSSLRSLTRSLSRDPVQGTSREA